MVDADTVLFVGHSGGGHGLPHNIDRLADELRSSSQVNGDGHRILWAEWGNYDCTPEEPSCPPRWEVYGEYRPRLEQQVGILLNDFATRSELARGEDDSLGGTGNVPTYFIWMPDCGSHAGAYDEMAYNGTLLGTTAFSPTMRVWLEDFVAGDKVNRMGWRIDDWQDSSGHAMVSICPP